MSHRRRTAPCDPVQSSTVFQSTDCSTLKADIAKHPRFATKAQKLPLDDTARGLELAGQRRGADHIHKEDADLLEGLD